MKKIVFLLCFNLVRLYSLEFSLLSYVDKHYESVLFKNNDSIFFVEKGKEEQIIIDLYSIEHSMFTNSSELNIHTKLRDYGIEMFLTKEPLILLQLYQYKGFNFLSEYYIFDYTKNIIKQIDEDEFETKKNPKEFVKRNHNFFIPLSSGGELTFDEYSRLRFIHNEKSTLLYGDHRIENNDTRISYIQRKNIDISPNNLRIVFTGWSGELYQTNQVGEFSGLFIFGIDPIVQ